MKKLSLKQVKEIFTLDTLTRKANKSSNEPILKLISLVHNDNATIEVDTTSKSLNRGSVVECLIKLLLKNQKSAKRYTNKNSRADLSMDGVKYEIKYSSSKGYAHFNPNQDLSNLIFVNQYGAYLTSGENIILDKCCKHIKDIVMNKNVQTLIDFNEMVLVWGNDLPF